MRHINYFFISTLMNNNIRNRAKRTRSLAAKWLSYCCCCLGSIVPRLDPTPDWTWQCITWWSGYIFLTPLFSPHITLVSLSHTHTHIYKKKRRRRHPSQHIRLRLRASATFPFPLSQRIAEPTELREAENKINWKEKEEEKNRRRRSDISSAGSFDPRISFLLACIVSFRLFVLSLSTNRFHKKIIHSLVSCRVLFLSRLPPLS